MNSGFPADLVPPAANHTPGRRSAARTRQARVPAARPAMKRIRYAVLTFGFLVAAVVPTRAADVKDDAKQARALVDKAIKAHGGAETVGKFHGTVVTFKGTFHGMGMELPMSGGISTSGADKVKADIEVEAGGQRFKVVNVVAGDKGWTKIGPAEAKDLGKDEITESNENQHAGWVASLAPLVSGKGFALTTAGELLVNDKPTLGVKVSAKGRRDVTLYFDKDTGLLARYEVIVKDEGSGREVTQETFPTEYKDVQGTKQPGKFTVKRDSKVYLEGEATAYQLSEQLDAGVFAKP
jgi:hypothetical protein